MAAHDGTQTAFAGYTVAVRLLPLLAFRGLERARRESRLSEWSTVTSDAAASALAVHKADDAIVLLEQGRGILWSQQLEKLGGPGRPGRLRHPSSRPACGTSDLPWKDPQKGASRTMSADDTPSVDSDELRVRIDSLIARYKETCSSESLDELFEVLLIASANLPDRAYILSQLSAVRLDRFRIRGDAADLAGAVESARSSLALTAPGQTMDRLMRQVNLGAALLEVTSRGGTAELSEAVELLREASEGLPAGFDERAIALANLCDGLQLSAERTADPEYLVDAIAVGQEAVAVASSSSGRRAAILTNHANAQNLCSSNGQVA